MDFLAPEVLPRTGTNLDYDDKWAHTPQRGAVRLRVQRQRQSVKRDSVPMFGGVPVQFDVFQVRALDPADLIQWLATGRAQKLSQRISLPKSA